MRAMVGCLGALRGCGVALLVVLTGCNSIEVEEHPAADFSPSTYRSLAWASPRLDERSPPEMRALERTVRKAVEKGLVARGYSSPAPQPSAAGEAGPDLLIDYRWSRRVEPRGAGSVSPADEVARIHDLDTTPAGDSAIYRHPVVDTAERVSLRVSLRDAATRELVWWGSASTVAPREGEHEARDLIERLADHVMRALPGRAQ